MAQIVEMVYDSLNSKKTGGELTAESVACRGCEPADRSATAC
jgi:hypothetical protein